VDDKAVKADEEAPPKCFEPAFSWKKTEALD
jgi:hypothetical protein